MRKKNHKEMITRQEVLNIQKKWSDGLLKIAEKHLNNSDYKQEAITFIESLYAYNLGEVLFKPTLASDSQFRLDQESALSYFIGANENYPEDIGFALKGWTNIRWENAGIQIFSDCAIAMGNYYFLDKQMVTELKIEFSVVYKKDLSGVLKIVLHDSHLPYQK